MSKKYEYLIFLTAQGTPRNVNLTIIKTFDHKITSEDIKAIDMEYPGGFGAEPYTVTNFKLINVTGTFTYRVSYEIHELLCDPTNMAELCTLDHQITTGSYAEDMISLIAQVRKSLSSRQRPQVISFQEIPDE